MMSNELVEASIALERFCLSFRVDLEESIEWSRAFESPDEDFAFASGEIWSNSLGSNSLIIEKIHGDNLLTTLVALKYSIRSLKQMPGMEAQIPVGGWCQWMRGYWSRLDSDASTPDDELICSSLMPALLVEGKSGWVAAYRHGEAQILEVGERSGTLSYWSAINPDDLCASIDAITLQLGNAIRSQLRRAPT